MPHTASVTSISGTKVHFDFNDLSFELTNVHLIESDLEAHVSKYECDSEMFDGGLIVIVDCGATPPQFEIAGRDDRSILYAATITHVEQDNINAALRLVDCKLVAEAV